MVSMVWALVFGLVLVPLCNSAPHGSPQKRQAACTQLGDVLYNITNQLMSLNLDIILPELKRYFRALLTDQLQLDLSDRMSFQRGACNIQGAANVADLARLLAISQRDANTIAYYIKTVLQGNGVRFVRSYVNLVIRVAAALRSFRPSLSGFLPVSAEYETVLRELQGIRSQYGPRFLAWLIEPANVLYQTLTGRALADLDKLAQVTMEDWAAALTEATTLDEFVEKTGLEEQDVLLLLYVAQLGVLPSAVYEVGQGVALQFATLAEVLGNLGVIDIIENGIYYPHKRQDNYRNTN